MIKLLIFLAFIYILASVLKIFISDYDKCYSEMENAGIAAGMLYWKMACKDCDSIEDCDSTGVAIRKATSSVLWGMLYCTAIKVISDIAYK